MFFVIFTAKVCKGGAKKKQVFYFEESVLSGNAFVKMKY